MSGVNKNNKIRILLIEENHLNLRIMSRFLQGLDIDVEAVNNAVEAIKYAINDRYSMIFMSSLMSQMTWLEIASKVQKLTVVNKNIPIIGISSDKNETCTVKMKESGICDIISKPLQEKDVNQLLEKYNLIETEVNTEVSEDASMFNIQEFEFFYNDSELQKEIVLAFIKENENDLDRIRKAFKSKNIDVIYAALHYMKGSFVYLKANKVLKYTQRMLDLLKDNKLNEVLSMEKLFHQYYGSLYKEINDYYKSLEKSI